MVTPTAVTQLPRKGMVVPGSELSPADALTSISAAIVEDLVLPVVILAIGGFFDSVKRECDRDGCRRGAGCLPGTVWCLSLEVEECLHERMRQA